MGGPRIALQVFTDKPPSKEELELAILHYRELLKTATHVIANGLLPRPD